MTSVIAELKAHGFVLHPLKGKIPLLKGWQALTKTPAEIEKHFENGGNVGAVCGKASDITVIDLDSFLFADDVFGGGIETLKACRTEGRGHVYFKYNPALPASKHHDLGVEVLSDGNNIVVPPSVHPSGDLYHWRNPSAPIIEMPKEVETKFLRLFKTEAELKQIITKCRHCFRDVIKRKPDMHGAEGREYMIAVATDMKANGATELHICMFAKMMYDTKYKEGRTLQEWRNIDPGKTWTCDVLRAKLPTYVDLQECAKCEERKKAYQETPRIVDPADNTDVGNARRLVALFGKDIRYCHPWKSWLCWNGKVWERDNTGQIFRYAKKTVQTMYDDAETMPHNDIREKLFKHSIASQSLAKLKAMVTLAESEREITILPEQFDRDIWLLNVKNKTLNFRNGQLQVQEHNREDFITKITPIEYDNLAVSENWMKFLNRVFEGKQKIIEYIQKVVGQMLTGDTSEENIYILWGTGANGKSTFVEIIAYILGEYAKTIGIESLLKKERNSVSNDIARLKGARFVYANEPEFGDHISEGKIKNLTGRDTIQARFLFQENFEFKPEYKLVISTNHKLIIKGMDQGIWRRIRMIPFAVTIPQNQRDKQLNLKLQYEAAGILNWIIKGCELWKNEGIQAPPEVIEATEDYQEEMDKYSEFFNVVCIKKTDAFTPFYILYFTYKVWCEISEIMPVSEKTFTQLCIERGFVTERKYDENGHRNRGLVGIHLSHGTDHFFASVPQFYEAADGDLRLLKDRLGQIVRQITSPFYWEGSRGTDEPSVPSVPSVPTSTPDSEIQVTVYNSSSVPSVPSVPYNKSIVIKIKELLDKINKPNSIKELENLEERILTELQRNYEYDNIDGDVIRKMIHDYFRVRGWS